MADFTARRIDDMEGGFGGAFKRARAELGVEAFGLAVIDLPPDFDRYPAHDHGDDGQEEVFGALSGSGELEVDGERTPLDPGVLVRVGPHATRRVLAGPEGIRLLVVGGVVGEGYRPSEFSRLGASDDAARSGPRPR